MANFPDAEDMTSGKPGLLAMSPCHRCLAEKANYNKFGVKERRCLNDTVSFLLRMHPSNERNTQLIEAVSLKPILSIPLVLSEFPFVATESSLDICNLFKVRPMHFSVLGNL